MSDITAANASAPSTYKREVKVDFSPETQQAPFLLRVGSMLIDYMVLVFLPVLALLYAKTVGEPLGIMTDKTLWLLSILLFLGNILILPLPNGRSLGKIITGLQIVRFDGTEASIWLILLRQTVGYIFTAVTLGLGFLFCVFSSNGRTLHDILTRTIVVQGRRRMK